MSSSSTSSHTNPAAATANETAVDSCTITSADTNKSLEEHDRKQPCTTPSQTQGTSSSDNPDASQMLQKVVKAWNDRKNSRNKFSFMLRESSLDRSCLDYLLHKIKKESEPAEDLLTTLVIYLDDIGRQHQQPNPQGPRPSQALLPSDLDLSDELIASFVQANAFTLKRLKMNARNQILGDDHRRNPGCFLPMLLELKKLQKLHLSNFDLCPVHAAVILWDYFACCLPPQAAMDDHGTPRTPPIINDSHYLTSLRLDRCLFDLTSMQMLSSGLRSYSKLTTLEMWHCGLTDELTAPLLDALQQSKSRLHKLDLRHNNLQVPALRQLALLLVPQSSLQVLNLSDNSHLFPNTTLAENPARQQNLLLGPHVPEDAAVVAVGAGNNAAAAAAVDNAARPLLQGAPPPDQDLQALREFCVAVSKHGSLQELRLSHCAVTAETLLPLMQLLSRKDYWNQRSHFDDVRPSLKRLFLQRNASLRLGEWVKCLPNLPHLQVLNLDGAPLVPMRLAETHASICQFMRQLSLNLSLIHLSVSEFAGNSNRNVFMRPAIRPVIVRNTLLWHVKSLIQYKDPQPSRQTAVATLQDGQQKDDDDDDEFSSVASEPDEEPEEDAVFAMAAIAAASEIRSPPPPSFQPPASLPHMGSYALMLHKLLCVQDGVTPTFYFLRSDLGITIIRECNTGTANRKKNERQQQTWFENRNKKQKLDSSPSPQPPPPQPPGSTA